MLAYQYEGPVLAFNRVVTPKWTGTTWATSEKKARANLTYQYKKSAGLLPSSKVTLPGKIVEINIYRR